MFSANASREEIFAEVQKWKKISIGNNYKQMPGFFCCVIDIVFLLGGTAFCILTAMYVFATEKHPHPLNQQISYARMRDGKPFPWSECDDCGFFEVKCWDECRARKEAWLKKKASGGN